MSNHKANLEELERQREGLENAVMMMSVEGIPVPDDLLAELRQVRAKLNELSAAGRTNIKRWTSWLGESIEGFTLKQLLSSGRYSHTFFSLNETSGEEAVFKVARSDITERETPADAFSRCAISFHLEMANTISLSSNQVLQHECAKLKSDGSGYFVPVVSEGLTTDNFFYFRMPFLKGQSLLELMQLTDMPFLQIAQDVFARLAVLLSRIRALGLYHGNLRPDSIFISKTDIILLSPGSFDLRDANLSDYSFMITSPAYYPFYEPNDLFALSCCFWEAVIKKHPLALAEMPERSDLFSRELREMLDYRKSLNHYPLWHFLKLLLPRELRPDLSAKAEEFMLKGLKLAFDSQGFLTASPGFSGADEFGMALTELYKQGILRKE